MIELDSYVRHNSGDWKVNKLSEPVQVWRIAEDGAAEERSLPANELTKITQAQSEWLDPADC